MSGKWLCANKLLAVLALFVGGLSCSTAAAFQDTTPYGLVYASGTLTDDGSTVNGVATPTGEQDQVSIAFFRPPTGVATSPISFGFLPGSVRVTKSDGTVLLDAENVQPSYIFFAFMFGSNLPLPTPVMSVPMTYQGQAATMQVVIIPAGDVPTPLPSSAVAQVEIIV